MSDTQQPITTVWMWQQDGEVWGLTINTDKGVIEWADGIGCACGDSFAEQTFADFLARGPRYGSPPDDVLAQVHSSLHALTQSASGAED